MVMRRGGGCHRAGMLPRLSPAHSINLAAPCPACSKPGYGPKPNWQGQCLPVSMFAGLCTPLLAGRAACMSPAPPSLLVAAPAQPRTAAAPAFHCTPPPPPAVCRGRLLSLLNWLHMQRVPLRLHVQWQRRLHKGKLRQRQSTPAVPVVATTGTSASLCCWPPGQLSGPLASSARKCPASCPGCSPPASLPFTCLACSAPMLARRSLSAQRIRQGRAPGEAVCLGIWLGLQQERGVQRYRSC